MVHGLDTLKAINADALREAFERQPQSGEPQRKLLIAIDYDDTFTADKAIWTLVIQVLSVRHKVICVSSRRCNLDNHTELRKHLPDNIETIVLAYDKPKREAARQAGFEVDIWIDDRPETIATKTECLALVG